MESLVQGECAIVLTTAESKQQAELICRKILEKSLAACIHVQKAASFYLWQGQIKKADEYSLAIKTKRDLFEAISKVIKQNHNYDIPEIVQIPITNGSKEYLNWVKNSKYNF
ncbi:MAG: divalent-cation tolerance protein CutA [Holosporales bacterium]|jgi:periplasmic divalent cation tolerance protein|nr:divalent-cation tolerance protein CutA [Holosporales bacterium]